jgi:intracellular septation protein A
MCIRLSVSVAVRPCSDVAAACASRRRPPGLWDRPIESLESRRLLDASEPFISEFIIFRAGFEGNAWVAVIGIALLVIVFAGLSLWFNDERFFKMKPTMIYLLFAGILGWGLLRGKSYLALAIDEVMPLQHEGWMVLTRRMALFFLGLAIANEAIWRTMSDQAWVNFKTFGLPAAIFAFFMLQGSLFRKYEAKEKGRG